MKLDKYLAVGGAPGIHKLVASRGNGIIIEDRQEGRTRCVRWVTDAGWPTIGHIRRDCRPNETRISGEDGRE